MVDSRFLRVFQMLERRRSLVLGLLIAVLSVSILSLRNIQFDNSLDLMLPAHSPAKRMMAFLRTANFSNKVIISIEDKAGAPSHEKLFAAADRIAASLAPPLVTKVIRGMSAPDLMSDAGFFLQHAPQILRSNDLAAIDARLTPEGIDGILKQRYLQLLKPEGMFTAQAMQADPLDINSLILGRLQELSTSLGYAVKVQNGHFISQDGRHAMLILETPASVTDITEARELLTYLDEKTRMDDPSLRVTLISGYSHTVSNDRTIKRDLGIIFSIASIGFILVFVIFFRDVRGLVVFLIPALSVVIAMALTAFLFQRISYFVIAFGPVIAGIADDYGIATYVAVRYGKKRSEAVSRVAMPVFVGALATAGIFLAFFFSKIPGYHQLGFFCVTSILLSLLMALFIMPNWCREHTQTEPAVTEVMEKSKRKRLDLLFVALFFIFLAVAGTLACRVQFDSDVTRLDGTAKAILDGEQTFKEVWGNGEKSEAILAVVGTHYEQVMSVSDEFYLKADALVGPHHLASLSTVWPPRAIRAENIQQWIAFWQAGRAEKLRSLLALRGATYGFTTNAFEPFFTSLYPRHEALDEPVSNSVFSSLKDRFAQSSPGGFQAMSFFPDNPSTVHALETAIAGRPDVFVVSRSALSAILSDAFSGEIVRMSCFALIFILLITFMFLRTLKATLVALIPAVAGVVGLLGLLAATGMPLNVSSLISGIVVFGLCIDFGIHVLHACRHHAGGATRAAITLAATTTLLGAGVLLFAKHPALFSVGVTLVSGVGVGYVAAMWVVPAFHALLWDDRKADHT